MVDGGLEEVGPVVEGRLVARVDAPFPPLFALEVEFYLLVAGSNRCDIFKIDLLGQLRDLLQGQSGASGDLGHQGNGHELWEVFADGEEE